MPAATAMPYLQGLMIDAQLELCLATGQESFSARAETLARRAAARAGDGKWGRG
jgi:hypothetical protein